MSQLIKIMFFICFFVFAQINLFSQEIYIKQKGIESHSILHFKYENQNAQQVSAVFSWDNYSHIYHMVKDPLKRGSFYLNIDPQKMNLFLDKGVYTYKFLVDDIYTNDPQNPDFILDPYKGKMSVLKIDAPVLNSTRGPVKLTGRTYRFFFNLESKDQKVDNIFIVGNFNNWAPYHDYLKQSDNPLIWYIDITFDNAGDYQYMFIIGENWVKDIYNPEVGINRVKQEVSVLHVD